MFTAQNVFDSLDQIVDNGIEESTNRIADLELQLEKERQLLTRRFEAKQKNQGARGTGVAAIDHVTRAFREIANSYGQDAIALQLQLIQEIAKDPFNPIYDPKSQGDSVTELNMLTESPEASNTEPTPEPDTPAPTVTVEVSATQVVEGFTEVRAAQLEATTEPAPEPKSETEIESEPEIPAVSPVQVRNDELMAMTMDEIRAIARENPNVAYNGRLRKSTLVIRIIQAEFPKAYIA